MTRPAHVSIFAAPAESGWRALALAGSVLLLGGCLLHEARIEPAPAPGFAGEKLVGTKPATPWTTAPIVRTGALPIELVASAAGRMGEDDFARATARVATPKPWWQRFPCDFVADLIPVTYTCRAVTTLTVRPLVAKRAEDLYAEASAAGFARAEVPDAVPVPQKAAKP